MPKHDLLHIGNGSCSLRKDGDGDHCIASKVLFGVLTCVERSALPPPHAGLEVRSSPQEHDIRFCASVLPRATMVRDVMMRHCCE